MPSLVAPGGMLVNQHAYRRLVCSSKADLESINMALTDYRTLLHGDLRAISNRRAVCGEQVPRPMRYLRADGSASARDLRHYLQQRIGF
jgi:hypothetical protein